jgi:hypothetical protein
VVRRLRLWLRWRGMGSVLEAGLVHGMGAHRCSGGVAAMCPFAAIRAIRAEGEWLAGIGITRRSLTWLLQPLQQGFIEHIRNNRLGNEVIHPCCEALILVLDKSICRHRQNGRSRALG